MDNNGKAYRVFQIFNTIFMWFIIVVTLYPILYVTFASLSDSNKLMAHTGLLLAPIDTNIEAYKMVFKNPNIISGYLNTLFVVIVGLAVNMVMTIIAAYILSQKRLALKNVFTFYIVFTMYFSGGLIPLFLTVKQLGLDNSLWALIIPGAMSAYNMIIMRTSFQSLPDSLIESATLDGAGPIRILIRIVVPLSMPTIAVIILYYAVGHWNSWFGAMIYLRDRAKFPLQLILREILIQNDTSSMTQGTDMGDTQSVAETVQYAIIMVATLPILMVYPFLQKYFVKGVMVGAIKG